MRSILFRYMRGGMRLLAFSIPAALHAQSYFQQQVDYRIQVALDDGRHLLNAYEEFDYLNNAPQALDTIRIHLWPNAYHGRNTALCRQMDGQNNFVMHFASEAAQGWIDSLDFRSDGRRLTWGYDPANPDIGWIKLPAPLPTGSRITITTPFRVKVPSARISRLGHIGQAYYITQWFPKPAVLDNKGWHAMPYLHQGEFYSEFGSFDVSITLPANYVVGATGELQNATEQAWMDSLARLPLTTLKGDDPFPPSSPTLKTLHFKQDRVHDFAWFADKRFEVRKGSVTLARSGHDVTTWVLFTPHNASLWNDAITYVNESVRLYSEWIGDYPYSACTAIDGGSAAGGGMEYPMVTIINDSDTPFMLDVVIAHEVGHNWFYGMLGSNEREHPWMDEGMNSYCELRYVETRYPDRRLMDLQGIPLGFLTRHEGITYRTQDELLYRYNARRNWDTAPDSHSKDFTDLSYGSDVYSKTALVFDQLRAYLGDPLFDRCMQRYFDDWHYKHPYPEDCRAVFEQVSGKDLGWCFAGLLGTSAKYDVRRLATSGTTLRYTVQGPPAPFPVTLHGELWKGPSWVSPAEPDPLKAESRNWENGRIRTDGYDRAVRRYTDTLPYSAGEDLRADLQEHTLDIDRHNNEVRATGLLKRTRLPEVRFLAGLERPDRGSIYWTPALGYNAHDGWMGGITLRNTTLPARRLEWAAAPLFGFQSERLAGGARIVWNHDRLRSRALRNLHVGVSAFAASLESTAGLDQWYQRVVPFVQADLRGDPNGAEVNVRYRMVDLWQHAGGTLGGGESSAVVAATQLDAYHELRFERVQKHGLNPYALDAVVLRGEAFTRISLDANWAAIYDVHNHRVSFRLFAGDFLDKNAALMRPEMGWRLYWGSSDLLYDHLFLDRQYVGENTAQQFVKDQGGFKSPTANGTSDTWIGALNMEADLPFRLPLTFFASYGAAPYTLIGPSGSSTDWKGYWEAGIGIRAIPNVLEVWVPLAYSSEIKDELENVRKFDFTERIRFVLALEKMDPSQLLRNGPH